MSSLEPLEPRRLLAAVPVVFPTAETDPVPHPDEAADDIAVWVHPTDPALSTIIGTDKAERNPAEGGIAVYDLDGREIQYREEGDINNVDIRYNFFVNGEPTTIVAASNSDHNSIELYRVNARTRKLENIAARRLHSDLSGVSGIAMYHSEATGRHYVFVNDRSGRHEQWELFDNGDGRVDGQVVRQFDAGHETEGIVADDELGWLYIAEEDFGIWKYSAEADADDDRTLVERVEMGDADGPLIPDVEGLTIYYARDGGGYLIASSQGSNDYAIFERNGENRLISKFRIGGADGVDRATDSDGIDVASVPLGASFPFGVFIAQDVSNGQQNQNFKLVPWERIAATNPQHLVIDGSQDPRTLVTLDDGGVLRVIGSSEDNRIRIERSDSDNDDLFVQVDEDEQREFDWEDVSRIVIKSLGGSDDVRVTRTQFAFTIPIRATGAGGDDTMVGGAGDDRLSGGSGHDKLFGRDGEDWIVGGNGADRLDGDDGADMLIGGPDADRLNLDEDDEFEEDPDDELLL